ncbi:hypothetical protein C7974DRAFT_177942 [Boeremia exigua]|uniref:uncharacterized protein n=1 Tax=Boeremia exigua TaxID=749465 RepID=UPI001E8DDAB8|nr:uncharacterized protein C7974DRAFT_177942 [Boeremia exigua]KAH6633763.1 hypothetical protein C7974DRAFT_177942 [Boeremia exigua]
MLIPNISEVYIKDKSKANWFAKALVCMQACWFITQVVGRVATSYPITLLEMNTLMHALWCLVIYLAWWHKPLNIDEPTIIRTTDERTRKMCAWMIMSSTLGVSKQLHFIPRHDYQGRRKAYIVYAEDISSDRYQLKTDYGETFDWTQTDNTQQATCLPRKDDSHYPGTAKGKQALVSLSFGQLIHGFRLVSYSKRWPKKEQRPPDDAHVLLTLAEVYLASLLRAEDPVWNLSDIVRLLFSLGSIVTHMSEVDEYRYAFSWAKHDDSVLFGFRGSTSLTQRFKKHASRFVWGNFLFGGATARSTWLPGTDLSR